MSGYPYHTGSSFVRHPGGYAHDAFGHVGADDAGVRQACFRKIPHTGIDISSKEPRTKNGRDNRAAQRSTPVVSPVNGTIVAAGHDPEAGNYHIIKADGRDEWWIGGHHSAFAKSAGWVARGQHIANMGDTGGAAGVHVHWSVATSLAGAYAYINGWIQYRNGRSVAAWSRQAIRGKDGQLYPLLDPWPLIEREWADEVRQIAARKTAAEQAERDRARAEAEAKARREEEEMSAAADEIKSVIRRESRVRLREHATTGHIMLESIKDGYVEIWHPSERPGWEKELTRNNEAIVTEREVTNRPKLDDAQWRRIKELAGNQLERIGKAAADELAKRDA